MTQQQQLSLLNSIMPDILETKDPKGVMLKCAREHNLSPAQLEHLGQCFNTAKTLVGLEKQANRGDAFTIVNVPEMLAEYVTYDADKAGKPDATSKKVTKLMKFAHTGVQEDVETGDRYYDPVESVNHLPSLFTMCSTHDIATTSPALEKAAADIRVVNEPAEWQKEEVLRNMKQIVFETTQDIREKCASLCRIARTGGSWQEMAEDALSYFGEAAHAAIETVDAYAQNVSGAWQPFDMQKSANISSIARDRHNAMPVFGELLKAAHYKVQAMELLEEFEPAPEKKAESQTTTEELLDAIGSVKKTKEEDLLSEKQSSVASTANLAGTAVAQKAFAPLIADREKYIEKAKQKGEEVAAIQKLMLEDPVINEADPHEVYELYKTVSALSPTLAQRPTTLAPIVREALQYGSLPVQTVTALLNAEQMAAKTKQYKQEG